MALASESLRNARDCILEAYTARKGAKSREELIELMDKNIWISPTQAQEYGLLDRIVPLEGGAEEEPAAFVATAGSRMRITTAMREKYQAHVAAQRETAANEEKARRARARLRALATY